MCSAVEDVVSRVELPTGEYVPNSVSSLFKYLCKNIESGEVKAYVAKYLLPAIALTLCVWVVAFTSIWRMGRERNSSEEYVPENREEDFDVLTNALFAECIAAKKKRLLRRN